MGKKDKEPRLYKCEGCGEVNEHTLGGRLPKFCVECRPRNDADALGSKQRQSVLRRQSAQIQPWRVSVTETQAMRAAIGIGLCSGDDVRACRIAGMDLAPDEAKRVCDEARLKHRDLIEGRPSSISALTDRAAMQMAVALLESSHLISPRDLPAAMRCVAQFKELFVGEAKQSFSSITVSVAAPVPDRAIPSEAK
jgi:hypothetical protein